MSIADHMAGMASEAAKGPMKAKPMPGKEEGGEYDGAKEMIHAHLGKIHELHGGAHTHITHHPEGHHESHHVSEGGEVSGPHDHDGSGCAECVSGKGGDEDSAENDHEGLM